MLNKVHSLKILLKSQSIYRTLCTKALRDEAAEKIPVAKRKKMAKAAEPGSVVNKEMRNHFERSARKDILTTFPESLLKSKTKSRTPTGFYQTCKKTARTIFDELQKDLPEDRPVLESNPGNGYLTQHLIQSLKNDLYLYEQDSYFYPQVASYIEEYPQRIINVRNKDLNSIDRFFYIDSQDGGTRIQDIFRGIPVKKYSEEPAGRIFMATFSKQFLRHMLKSIVLQNSITAYGRFEYYICLSPSLWAQLTCAGSDGYQLYRSTAVLFQILCEYEFICKFKRKDFLPWVALSTGKTTQKVDKVDADSVYFVRIVPRQNLHLFCVPENLTALWYFVSQHFVKRANRIIPEIEKWIPGSGVRLIINSNKGTKSNAMKTTYDVKLPRFSNLCLELNNREPIDNFNIFTEFGELSPMQIFTIFDQFVNFPEYKECSFHASMESAMLKLQSNQDDPENLDSELLVESEDKPL